jgi:predicted DNA-binding protein
MAVNRKAFLIRLPPELDEEVNEFCRVWDVSKNKLLERAVKKYIKTFDPHEHRLERVLDKSPSLRKLHARATANTSANAARATDEADPTGS